MLLKQSKKKTCKWCRKEFIWPIIKTETFVKAYIYNLNYLGPVFQRVDNAIQRVNRYSDDKKWQNVIRYSLEGDLSNG